METTKTQKRRTNKINRKAQRTVLKLLLQSSRRARKSQGQNFIATSSRATPTPVSQKRTPNIGDLRKTTIQLKRCNKSENKCNKKLKKNAAINPETPD